MLAELMKIYSVLLLLNLLFTCFIDKSIIGPI